MARFTEKRFDLYWLGTIHENGEEDFGNVVATSKTLSGIRKYAKMKKISDDDHTILEIGGEKVSGLWFEIETTIAEHKIQI